MPVVLPSLVSRILKQFEILSMGQASSDDLKRVEGSLVAPEWSPRRSLGCRSQPSAWRASPCTQRQWGSQGLLPAAAQVLPVHDMAGPIPTSRYGLAAQLWERAGSPVVQHVAGGSMGGQARQRYLEEDGDLAANQGCLLALDSSSSSCTSFCFLSHIGPQGFKCSAAGRAH